MKPEWFRQLYKAADIVFDVPVGADCWPSDMYEPLIVGIVFPFLRHPPWQLRLTPKMFSLARDLRGLWEGPTVGPGDFLRIFFWSTKGFAPCHQMWCGGCYSSSPNVQFQVKQRAVDIDDDDNDPQHQQ
jgi:hypothetical protein